MLCLKSPRQHQQVLHGQRTAGRFGQGLEAPLESLADPMAEAAVALGTILGDQIEDGLQHLPGRLLAQQAEVALHLAEQGQHQLIGFRLQSMQCLTGVLVGIQILQGRCAQPLAPMAATSAAKSVAATSIPCPRTKRAKRRTTIFSPSLPEVCLTRSSTLSEVSLMKG